MSKWEDFRKANTSSLTIDKPNRGDANILVDWTRSAYKKGRVKINGVDLEQLWVLASDWPGWGGWNGWSFEKQTQYLRQFFHNKILKDFKVDDATKTKAVDYLMTAFHQGGLLHPVSSALAIETPQSGSFIWGNQFNREVHIKTTSTGFKLQEWVSTSNIKKEGEDGWVDENAQNQDIQVEAQGIIDVNFSQGTEVPTTTNPNVKLLEPVLTVESNQMNVYDAALKPFLDKRSLGQMIVDFIKDKLGLNKVTFITPEAAEQDKEEVPDGPSP